MCAISTSYTPDTLVFICSNTKQIREGKYLPNMNKFCNWLSETKVISVPLFFYDIGDPYEVAFTEGQQTCTVREHSFYCK